MHLARQAIVAAHVRRDIEERLLVERAVLIRRPTVLVAVQDIQPLHRTATDHAAYIWPDFVQAPAAIRQHTAAPHPHITAVFEYILTIRSTAWHRTHEPFKTRAQMLPQMHAQRSAYTERRALRTAQTTLRGLGRITVTPKQITGVQHHAAGKTLIDLVFLDVLTYLGKHSACQQQTYKKYLCTHSFLIVSAKILLFS